MYQSLKDCKLWNYYINVVLFRNPFEQYLLITYFIFFISVALGTRVQPNRLPTGATSKSNFDNPYFLILLTFLSRFLNLTKVFLTCLKSTITNRAFFYWPELIMRRIEFDHKHNLYLARVNTYFLSESFINLVWLGRMCSKETSLSFKIEWWYGFKKYQMSTFNIWLWNISV